MSRPNSSRVDETPEPLPYYHAADLLGADALFGQRLFEQVEARVLAAEAVGIGYLNERGVERADPFLERRDSAGELRTERSTVKRAFEADDDLLVGPADRRAVRARQFQAALDGFAARGQDEGLVEFGRRQFDESLGQQLPSLSIIRKTGPRSGKISNICRAICSFKSQLEENIE